MARYVMWKRDARKGNRVPADGIGQGAKPMLPASLALKVAETRRPARPKITSCWQGEAIIARLEAENAKLRAQIGRALELLPGEGTIYYSQVEKARKALSEVEK